jgi:hypothetical protein
MRRSSWAIGACSRGTMGGPLAIFLTRPHLTSRVGSSGLSRATPCSRSVRRSQACKAARFGSGARNTLRINSTHAHAERGLDPYWTPAQATRALLAIERVPVNIWEPACGNGAITNVLRNAGHAVVSSDIVPYDGFTPDLVADFLTVPVPHGVQGIITNPPFRLALEFAKKAIVDVPYVALLLRLNFLESVERLSFFHTTPPARIWVSSRRLPMMHRLNWSGPRSTSNHAFAWFIWERGAPRAELRWFDWRIAA